MTTRAAKLTIFLLAALAAAGSHSSAFGQSEDRDRPDSVGGSRSIGGKDDADPQRRRQTPVSPDVFIEKELRAAPRAANVNKLRSISNKMTTLGAGGAESTYADAVERAKLDYAGVFKAKFEADTDYKNSHALLRLEDFARAYVMALNPKVSAQLDGFKLAELRSMVTVYDSYEAILETKVPGLTRDEIKGLAREAKEAVKALLSK
jgi:hypothetical protein